MEPRTHGADGAAERLGRIRITQLLQIAQDHRLAIPQRQAEDGAPHRLDPLRAREIVQRIGVVVDQRLAVRSVLERLERTLACASWVAEKQRPATSRLPAPCGSSVR